MSDIVSSARTAREKLAQALAALQAPDAGSLIDTVAAPVAQAMGALHRIESTEGAEASTAAPVALDAVRRALAALQEAPAENTAAASATEHVAGSLGLVHNLAQSAVTAPSTPAEPPVGTAPRAKVVEDHALAATEPIGQQSPAAEAALAATQVAAPAAVPATAPVAAEAAAAKAPAPDHHPGPDGPLPGALEVAAELGAHSPTNFYKGLSGNDVIDDGGIFIATYQIPALGKDLWIKVSMPGGYEFAARGQVKWTREVGSSDSPPGFGAQIQDISTEARQLVYRYVRNREPLFHDDF